MLRQFSNFADFVFFLLECLLKMDDLTAWLSLIRDSTRRLPSRQIADVHATPTTPDDDGAILAMMRGDDDDAAAAGLTFNQQRIVENHTKDIVASQQLLLDFAEALFAPVPEFTVDGRRRPPGNLVQRCVDELSALTAESPPPATTSSSIEGSRPTASSSSATSVRGMTGDAERLLTMLHSVPERVVAAVGDSPLTVPLIFSTLWKSCDWIEDTDDAGRKVAALLQRESRCLRLSAEEIVIEFGDMVAAATTGGNSGSASPDGGGGGGGKLTLDDFDGTSSHRASATFGWSPYFSALWSAMKYLTAVGDYHATASHSALLGVGVSVSLWPSLFVLQRRRGLGPLVATRVVAMCLWPSPLSQQVVGSSQSLLLVLASNGKLASSSQMSGSVRRRDDIRGVAQLILQQLSSLLQLKQREEFSTSVIMRKWCQLVGSLVTSFFADPSGDRGAAAAAWLEAFIDEVVAARHSQRCIDTVVFSLYRCRIAATNPSQPPRNDEEEEEEEDVGASNSAAVAADGGGCWWHALLGRVFVAWGGANERRWGAVSTAPGGDGHRDEVSNTSPPDSFSSAASSFVTSASVAKQYALLHAFMSCIQRCDAGTLNGRLQPIPNGATPPTTTAVTPLPLVLSGVSQRMNTATREVHRVAAIAACAFEAVMSVDRATKDGNHSTTAEEDHAPLQFPDFPDCLTVYRQAHPCWSEEDLSAGDDVRQQHASQRTAALRMGTRQQRSGVSRRTRWSSRKLKKRQQPLDPDSLVSWCPAPSGSDDDSTDSEEPQVIQPFAEDPIASPSNNPREGGINHHSMSLPQMAPDLREAIVARKRNTKVFRSLKDAVSTLLRPQDDKWAELQDAASAAYEFLIPYVAWTQHGDDDNHDEEGTMSPHRSTRTEEHRTGWNIVAAGGNDGDDGGQPIPSPSRSDHQRLHRMKLTADIGLTNMMMLFSSLVSQCGQGWLVSDEGIARKTAAIGDALIAVDVVAMAPHVSSLIFSSLYTTSQRIWVLRRVEGATRILSQGHMAAGLMRRSRAEEPRNAAEDREAERRGGAAPIDERLLQVNGQWYVYPPMTPLDIRHGNSAVARSAAARHASSGTLLRPPPRERRWGYAASHRLSNTETPKIRTINRLTQIGTAVALIHTLLDRHDRAREKAFSFDSGDEHFAAALLLSVDSIVQQLTSWPVFDAVIAEVVDFGTQVAVRHRHGQVRLHAWRMLLAALAKGQELLMARQERRRGPQGPSASILQGGAVFTLMNIVRGGSEGTSDDTIQLVSFAAHVADVRSAARRQLAVESDDRVRSLLEDCDDFLPG